MEINFIEEGDAFQTRRIAIEVTAPETPVVDAVRQIRKQTSNGRDGRKIRAYAHAVSAAEEMRDALKGLVLNGWSDDELSNRWSCPVERITAARAALSKARGDIPPADTGPSGTEALAALGIRTEPHDGSRKKLFRGDELIGCASASEIWPMMARIKAGVDVQEAIRLAGGVTLTMIAEQAEQRKAGGRS